MKTTTYLTGQHPERYKELLEPLADMRIADMKLLLDELREAAGPMEKPSSEYYQIKKRFKAVQDGISWWTELKYEGEIDHEQ